MAGDWCLSFWQYGYCLETFVCFKQYTPHVSTLRPKNTRANNIYYRTQLEQVYSITKDWETYETFESHNGLFQIKRNNDHPLQELYFFFSIFEKKNLEFQSKTGKFTGIPNQIKSGNPDILKEIWQ